MTEALAKAGLDAPVDDLIDAHGDGRRRAVFHARRGTHDVLEVGFAARRRIAWWRSIAVPSSRRPRRRDRDRLGDCRGAGGNAQAARHSGHGDRDRPRCRRARIRPADRRADGRARRDRRSPPSRAPHPPWRDGGAADEADAADRARPSSRCLRVPSCRQPPPAKPAWRGWWQTHCAGARTVADLFCGVGPFALRLAERARITAADNDAAAIAALQRAATGAQGPQADRGARARPLPPPVRAGRTQAIRRRRVRSAAAGRRGAGARARGVSL